MQQQDILIRAMLGENQARMFALRTTGIVREAQERHGTTPVATAALGRALTIGLVFGVMMKGQETITIQIKGDGPLQGIVVSANSWGEVKGYVGNPYVDLPLSAQGKLDVGQGVGQGSLHVIRDLGLKAAYQGTVPLQSGEIGDDFAYYFTHSEQTPSAVALGVLVGTDGIPLSSGGIVVQLLPEAIDDNEFITLLEESLQNMPAASELFSSEETLEQIVKNVFPALKVRVIDTQDVRFRCDCSQDRFEQGLITLGIEELQELVKTKETIETVCHFCNKRYCFTEKQIHGLLLGLVAPQE